MGKYYDYLVANGATAEEAKALDSPISEKLYLKQLSDQEAEITRLKEEAEKYQTSVQNWYTNANGKLTQAQNDAIAAKAEEARAKAALVEAQKRGLLDVAKDLGWSEEPPKKELPAADDRYVSKQDFGNLMSDAGASLARMADLKDEYFSLTGQRLNLSALVAESKAAGAADIFSYADKKFNLPAKREEAAKKSRDEEIAKWKAEGAREKETEMVSQYGNPATRPMMPSQRPIFATRTGDGLREGKNPWDQTDGKLAADRQERATKKAIERLYQN